MDFDAAEKKAISAIISNDMAEALKSWKASDFCARTCGPKADDCNKSENYAKCFQFLVGELTDASIATDNPDLSRNTNWVAKKLQEHLNNRQKSFSC